MTNNILRIKIASTLISASIVGVVCFSLVNVAKANDELENKFDGPVWDTYAEENFTEGYDAGYKDGWKAKEKSLESLSSLSSSSKPKSKSKSRSSSSLNSSGLNRLAKSLGVEVAALKALVYVEAKHANKVPKGKIPARYERHVMYSCLKKKGIRVSGRPSDLVHRLRDRRKHTDDYPYIARAIKINKECAHRATSWSVYQIMGYNFSYTKWKSATAMAKAMHDDPKAKDVALVGFLKHHAKGKALKAFKKKRWTKFARLYNGDNFKENRYHIKIAKAYAKFSN